MENKYKVKEQVWATKGKRFLNFIIDRIVVYAIVFGLSFLLGVILNVTGNYELLDSIANMNGFIDSLITLTFYVTYFIVIESKYQVSVGKLLTGSVIVDEYGEKPTTSSIIKRSFSRLIPFDAFSFLGENSYGWHDSLSSTYVVDKKLLEEKKILFDDLNKIGQE
ncbi:RDD family protein [Pseudofulvibacter geojedonensis]|uniref:RDD family protein n=1 Tax=Pseudofulvibacter geojedonensis TaxID=1123758 RepID=A0ABW3I4F4_9FLAO